MHAAPTRAAKARGYGLCRLKSDLAPIRRGWPAASSAGGQPAATRKRRPGMAKTRILGSANEMSLLRVVKVLL